QFFLFYWQVQSKICREEPQQQECEKRKKIMNNLRLAFRAAKLLLVAPKTPTRPTWTQIRLLGSTNSLCKSEDVKAMLKSLPKRDEGVDGERDTEFDPHFRHDVAFPDADTPNRLFNGVPFSQLPIMCVRATKNNTHMVLANSEHTIMWRRSCGQEGFKKCRKGTNVAAQTTAIGMAKKALDLGVTQVRVKLRGFGAGRLAAVKAFEMAGLDVVSLTDVTYINWRNNPRAKKQRRL
ncbi:unnamed protein product, partial [Notodromas monacha]